MTSTRNRPTKQQQQTADENLVAGLQKHEASLPSLLIAGTTVPVATLVSTLQVRMAARANTVSIRAAYQDAVKSEREAVAQSEAVVSGTKQALRVMFAGQIVELGDFGLKARKAPTPLTAEEKVAAAARAKATREARHTMGPKQKAKITRATPGPVTPSPSKP